MNSNRRILEMLANNCRFGIQFIQKMVRAEERLEYLRGEHAKLQFASKILLMTNVSAVLL